MTVKINGKPFDLDGDDLFPGELPDGCGELPGFLWLAALSLLGIGVYPWLVHGIAWVFRILLTGLGVFV